jgi:hypothetical protein
MVLLIGTIITMALSLAAGFLPQQAFIRRP